MATNSGWASEGIDKYTPGIEEINSSFSPSLSKWSDHVLTQKGTKLYVITEADRSATTIMLAEEY